MDSVSFCGETCHSVMAPEFTAYQNSPHSRVACVDCHIGPGASWAVRAKIDGTRQVLAMALRTYSRPIPSPVHTLRPARETCEQCHWPQKFHGDRLVVRKKYADDEHNTLSVTVLVMKIGGRDTRGVSGIHGRHLDEASRITYVTSDAKRQVIPRVTYVDDAGRTVEYVSAETKAEAGGAIETRSMDCVDCHNRPTHAYELPERAVDRELASGGISPDLPWVKKKTVELLRTEYADRETAFAQIRTGLTDYYRREHPQVYQGHRAQVEAAAQRAVDVYARNVFPEMKLGWGTHPNNIGHEDFLGCFRCHDDNHKSADGRVISQDCNACHAVLAMDEQDPKILAELGLQ
jgi:nitrate/TMAO reductase-like tetraheme cytochrome c subunit